LLPARALSSISRSLRQIVDRPGQPGSETSGADQQGSEVAMPSRTSASRIPPDRASHPAAPAIRRARCVATFALAFALAQAAPAAGLQRSFVATSGNDAAACARVSPCRSFAAAIGKTAAGGEVVVLDSGGYGPVTIAQSVTISAPDGVYAGISVLAGDGVTVDAPADAVVVLRGLAINGQGGASAVVLVNGAVLRVERCRLASMSDSGIVAQLAAGAELQVVDTSVERNANAGIRASGPGRVVLTDVRVAGNGAFGLLLQDGPAAALRRASLEQNNWGIGAFATTADVLLDVRDSRVFSNSRHGVWTQSAGAGTNSVSAIVSDSEIVRNNQSASVPSGGVFAQANLATSVSLSLVRDRIADNHGAGVYVDLEFPTLGASAVAFIKESVIQGNTGYGVTTTGLATAYTSGDNTIARNAGGDLNGNVVADPNVY
jgi:hypothetical protein